MKPLGRVKIKWSADFAYAICLLVTDGSLSKDGRHISFTSKDKEMMENFQRSLKVMCHIGKKSSGSVNEKKYYVIQIGDVLFYEFLLNIGLMPNKSRILENIKIPDKYFFHFLRGHFDGDGTFYSYFDPRWKSSFMFYLTFISASEKHIIWLRKTISRLAKVDGHFGKSNSVYRVRYAKAESLRLLQKMYDNASISLSRKTIKIFEAIHKVKDKSKIARVEKLVNSQA